MSYVTKQAMKTSLEKMLLAKPVNKITIADITNDCRISRMTFYYHFKDIYDLIVWSWMEKFVGALNDKKTYETWQEGFLEVFMVIKENRRYVENICDSISRERIEDYLYQLTYDLLIGVANDKAVGMNVNESDKKFIAEFYKYAFVGILIDWFENRMTEDPKQLVIKVNDLIEGSFHKYLNTYNSARV